MDKSNIQVSRRADGLFEAILFKIGVIFVGTGCSALEAERDMFANLEVFLGTLMPAVPMSNDSSPFLSKKARHSLSRICI